MAKGHAAEMQIKNNLLTIVISFMLISCTESASTNSRSLTVAKDKRYYFEFITVAVAGQVDTIYSLLLFLDSPNSLTLRHKKRYGFSFYGSRTSDSIPGIFTERIKFAISEPKTHFSYNNGEYPIYHTINGDIILNNLSEKERINALLRTLRIKLGSAKLKLTTVSVDKDSVSIIQFGDV